MTGRRIKADLAVIGGGSGGLSVAAGAAQLGLDVVLFERDRMGGDCLNYGCVPSKALIAAASAAHSGAASSRLGVSAEVQVDFPTVMQHVRQSIAAIAPHDSRERFEGLGVRVINEEARFLDSRTVASQSLCVRARRIVIATGSKPAIPPVPGISNVPYLTNETIFNLTELPSRLLVLGAGPIGIELGQAFRRLGSEVVIVDSGPLLAQEDPDAAAVVVEQLRADGIELLACHHVVKAERQCALLVEQQGARRQIEGSHLLIAAGRTPTIGSLDLERAGIEGDERGISTDRKLRTSNKRVYAIGDVAGRGQFTHLAGAHASLVIRNALFRLPVDADALVVPRVTYSDPELASVGLSEAAARQKHGDGVRVELVAFDDNDRARTEADVRGFGKLIATSKGRMLGGTLVGRNAGDHIHIFALAMASRLKLRQLAGMVAPYPTRGEIGKRLASQFYSEALFSSRTRKLVRLLNVLP